MQNLYLLTSMWNICCIVKIKIKIINGLILPLLWQDESALVASVANWSFASMAFKNIMEILMPQFHQQTKHSYISIRKNVSFLDWRTQPRSYKIYPHFYRRFKIADFEELLNLELIGQATFSHNYGSDEYLLRTTPSAGGLYPCEVYVQLRGIKNLLDGIYHYEPLNGNLTLIYELIDDGVESYFSDTSKERGFIFLISAIYFRSAWKYKNRAIRYIFLDSGHQAGAIYAALCVMKRESEAVFDFDKLSLNSDFGFENFEHFMAVVKSSQKTDTKIKRIRSKLPFVSGSDYLERDTFIEEAYKESAIYESQNIDKFTFFENIDQSVLKDAILKRRSIRAFRGNSISLDEFEFIFKDIFTFASDQRIDIFYTLHNVENKKSGLYKNETLIKKGDFRSNSGYLALEQKLGSQSAVTLYFTSNEVEKYQKVNILSGFLAHIIYLKSTMKNIGCSGIGAYYDNEVKQFLDTKNNILYLLSIGR